MPRHVLLLAIHANLLAIEAARVGDAAPAHRLNAIIARGVCSGAPYDHLAAARLGSGIRANQMEMMLLDTWLESEAPTASSLMDGLAQRLAKLEQGRPKAELEAAATTFIRDTVPLWRQLGAIA